jgi:hypothetical protein
MTLDESANHRTSIRATVVAINLLATLHIVWFYIYCVPSYLDLNRYEAGTERMPFQGRLLMQYPLRWAHSSRLCTRIAILFSYTTTWLPRPAIPEDIVQAVIDGIAVLIAGLVARSLYRRYSPTGLLTPFVYPFTLVMVTVSYCLQSTAFFRYVYDLPSLGFFAVGLWLIHRKANPALFAALFVVATTNRETTLFLLYCFVASACVIDGHIVWRRALTLRTIGTTFLLGLFYYGWHVWIAHRFAGYKSESNNNLIPNFATLCFPLLWPQIAGIAAYTLPLIVLFRAKIVNPELRLWLLSFPLWFPFMFYYGLVIEIRLFGELIPVFACAAMLLAENYLKKATHPEVATD